MCVCVRVCVCVHVCEGQKWDILGVRLEPWCTTFALCTACAWSQPDTIREQQLKQMQMGSSTEDEMYAVKTYYKGLYVDHFRLYYIVMYCASMLSFKYIESIDSMILPST